ncbi:LEAF RUST 10 DISEASE-RESISTANCEUS RECEPTOR-LIKE PROTEIN KINASE-like 2.4 isoform X2 [Gossypium hirsutum]|uniref:non-specific serine/threonine protein kinase n=1 Tax=Gossypium hirsutum TaxID=3635 RepID=A0ABM3B5I1_GOSHI|nr:LEAF RUST 10 DISEASE-RESISTANCE LOCUS RECEPTOR-LIKE PROTEIN KINASE-like 2.4 isoform X2 [Gossypium hirsutum]
MTSSSSELALLLLSLSFMMLGVAASQSNNTREVCGRQAGGALCPNGLCCSQFGMCGSTSDYCGSGCQSQCSGNDIGSIITQHLFNNMLKYLNDSRCPGNGFYTYSAFITAARSFNGFGTTGDLTTRKRELAAFLAQTSHETTGGWPSAPDGPYAWGYCFIREQNNNQAYCLPGVWPCPRGRLYYGRGPFQLAYNFNYGPAGRDIGVDLINNPDLVATNPTISFKTAIWFWMTPQGNKPSSHNVLVGQWTPSAAERDAGWLPGYGIITNIINGELECGHGPDDRVADRIGFYRRYCDILGVSYGSNLDCYNQRPHTSGRSQRSPSQLYEKCRDAVFTCGNISIGYPFSGGDREPECGHPNLELRCDFTNTTKIEIVGIKYKVLDIHQESRILRIARENFINNGSCRPQIPIQDSILNSEPFVPGSRNTNLTLLYDCQSSSSLGIFPCNSSNYNNVSITTDNIRGDGCSANVRVPVLQSSWERFRNKTLDLEEALETGFEVLWEEDMEACGKCNASGGSCGFNDSNNQTVCYCPSGFESSSHTNKCHRSHLPPSPAYTKNNNNTKGGSKSKLKLAPILTGLTVAGIVLVFPVCFIVLRFKGKSLSNYLQGKINDDARIEAFITKFGLFAPKRYSYEEIKKMTNKFNDKLGQGGFGSVYKGKLPDGHLVAVKFLSEMKGNGEDFMNEVASISRTSHVNIVTLLGFCFERSKRALIYEFMPKGSLDKFIYGQGSDNQSRQLEWVTLYDIALGIARGLEYLHQGCNTRILHFDIKPHNILLDENFCPKISDFGLSKLCEGKKSIVSMTGARGTAGYIAPEVFFRNLGGVSNKSDVYSYGMMVLEMVGGRKNVNVEASRTSEIYFPSWIYKHLDQSSNLNINEEVTEEEAEITRKLIAVSLWCIQTNPLDRPSMTRVLEMLQGSIQSLELPPRPT